MGSLMGKKDQRFLKLEEWLTRGGARAEDDFSSGREDEDEVHTGEGSPTARVVKAEGEFIGSSRVDVSPR